MGIRPKRLAVSYVLDWVVIMSVSDPKYHPDHYRLPVFCHFGLGDVTY